MKNKIAPGVFLLFVCRRLHSKLRSDPNRRMVPGAPDRARRQTATVPQQSRRTVGHAELHQCGARGHAR